MKLQRWLVLFLLLGCWLFSAACQGPQVEAGSSVSPVVESQSHSSSSPPPPVEDETDQYIEGKIGN